MTTKEFALIAAAIKTYFPRDNILPTERAMELWYEELKDLPYDIANTAVRMHVATNKFPPSIADIRENAAKLSPKMREGELNEMEARQMVLKAMRNSIYHAEEEFAKLPPTVQNAVVSTGQLREWAMAEDVDGTWMNVKQSNFMRTYRAEVVKDREMQKLSPDVLKLMDYRVKHEKIQQTETKGMTIAEERKLAERNATGLSGKLRKAYDSMMQALG